MNKKLQTQRIKSYLRWFNLRAKVNLKKWGLQDIETLGLAIAEESGELAQAILKNKYEKGRLGNISREAIDLGALCIQILLAVSKIGEATFLKRILKIVNKKHLRKKKGARP